MTKVEVFSTFKEADEKLRIHYSKNRDVIVNVFNELLARSKVYRQTTDYNRLHPGDKDAEFTTEEMILLSKGLAQGEAATAMIKLYAFDLNSYAFDYAVFNSQEPLSFAAYDSIKALAEKVREQLEQERAEHIRLTTLPLFYTVLEPFTYSEQDKSEAREAFNYKKLSQEDRMILDKHLDDYVERALTSAEIKRFVSSYTKFLN